MLKGCTPYPPEFAARYLRGKCWANETIGQAVATAASRLGRSQHALVVDSDRSLGYRALLDETTAIAATLKRHGLHSRDRIIVVLPNCIEFATLTLACLEIGAIPVMALPAFRRAEVEYLASASAARAIAISPGYRGFDYAAMAREVRSAVPRLEMIFSTERAPGCVGLRDETRDHRNNTAKIGEDSADPFDVALFLLSGGTTGMPKLIPRTHADYLYTAREAAAVCGLKPDSRILLALPVEHHFPLACPGLFGALLCGATAVFMQSSNAAELAGIIEREHVTHLPCVPTIALAISELFARERTKLRSLRVITVGGAKLKEAVARRFRQTYPWVVVQQVLGMSEGLLCYTRLDDPESVAFGTQGRPLSPADEIRIVDAAGHDVLEGDVGELWCRGPYTIRGYYQAPERNSDAFTSDGYYRTGDLVRRTPSGNLVVEGRLKDQINRGGEKLSADEIEAHLVAHPAVREAAVVAMPDERLGERACAYVTLRAGQTVDLDAVRQFFESRGVARFKWPERLEIIEAMPLTNVGKIRKVELRSDIERKLATEHAGVVARR
jgi:2,3-dihydroxybenzoate-AMP ligase